MDQGELLKRHIPGYNPETIYIGLLIGGDSKKFTLAPGKVKEVIIELRKAADELNAGILITTSRRTPKTIEGLLKDGLKDSPRSKLQIIANENNIPEAVGGILNLSSIIITSPESISMISEAASSGKPTLIFKMPGLPKRHGIFLKHLSEGRFIHLTETSEVGKNLKTLLAKNIMLNKLNDSILVKEALRKIV
jgi:mitochondrial fission protein ELM1